MIAKFEEDREIIPKKAFGKIAEIISLPTD
jgi:hypothetical protein